MKFGLPWKSFKLSKLSFLYKFPPTALFYPKSRRCIPSTSASWYDQCKCYSFLFENASVVIPQCYYCKNYFTMLFLFTYKDTYMWHNQIQTPAPNYPAFLVTLLFLNELVFFRQFLEHKPFHVMVQFWPQVSRIYFEIQKPEIHSLFWFNIYVTIKKMSNPVLQLLVSVGEREERFH